MRKPIKSSAKKTTKDGAKRKALRTSAKKTAVKAPKKGQAKKKVPRTGPNSQIPGITAEACRAIEVHAHNDVVTQWNAGDCYQNN
jgi:hypothetical protein